MFPTANVTSFPRAVQAKDDETVIFSWIVYPDRATRDAPTRRSWRIERLKKMMENPPFDGKRMIFGDGRSWDLRRRQSFQLARLSSILFGC